MSSRTRGPRNRASKLPVADKPQFAQKKKKRQGSKVRKSRSSPAEPSHGSGARMALAASSLGFLPIFVFGYLEFAWRNKIVFLSGTKAEVQKIATSPPHQGAKAEEPNIRACPHQGSENIFSFIFCKPDCPRSAADSYFCDRSSALCNFEDDSSSSSVPFPGYDPTKRYLD